MLTGGEALSKEIEKFKGMRRHVKRMLLGTPLLMRKVQANGKEDMKICIFNVSEDMTHLSWSEQLDGDGSSHEVKLSTIVSVKEEPGSDSMEDEDQGSLVLTMKDEGSGKLSTMELTCASAEDFVTWREGLQFIIGGGKISADIPESPASSVATAKRLRTSAPPTPSASLSSALMQTEPQAGSSEMREKIRQQDDEIAKLRQENRMLHEMVKRKDVTIAQLQRDLQNRPTASDLCSKTESTSRESDDHLRYRETVILKRKNQRLKSANEAKQQTISQLMGVLQNCLEKQNEALQLEDSEEDMDVADIPRPRGVQGASAQQPARDLTGDDDDSSEPDAIREEMRSLAGKLEQLERDVEELHPQESFGQGLGMPASTPMANSAVATTMPAVPPAPAAAAPVVAALSSTAPAPNGNFRPPPRVSAPEQAPAFDFSAVGGAPPSLGGVPGARPVRCSPAALQALEKELELLAEKKQVVERLARQLEPPSDNEEEDDGFPLR